MNSTEVTPYRVVYLLPGTGPGARRLIGETTIEALDIHGIPPTPEKMLELLHEREIDAITVTNIIKLNGGSPTK
jgi:hypothetical protein